MQYTCIRLAMQKVCNSNTKLCKYKSKSKGKDKEKGKYKVNIKN